jgi:ribonuclease HI
MDISTKRTLNTQEDLLKKLSEKINNTIMKNKIIIYTDGGSRGNPGPAGIGGVISLVDIKTGAFVKKSEFSEFIGDNRTNNEAEYEALIYALDQAKKVVNKKEAKQISVECFLDSELVVKQLNHQYKLRDKRIQKYFIIIWNLMLDYSEVRFTHVRREQNREADALVNNALDKKGSSLF